MRRALVVALLLAGCVAPAEGGDDAAPPAGLAAAWAERALPFGEQHDHTSRAQHANLSTPNFEIVAHEPLVSPTMGTTPGGHFCGDAQDTQDGRRLVAVEQRTIGGFALVDATDPAAPVWLGEFVMPRSRVYDLAVAPDGKHVVLVTTDQVNPPSAGAGLAVREGAALEWRGRCGVVPLALPLAATEDPVPRPASIVLVDVSDPSAPEVIDQRPLPTAGHSVFPTVLDGAQVLLISATMPNNGYYQLYELLETPLGARLHHRWSYAMSTENAPTDPSQAMAHDGWIAEHPVTGQPLAYLAGGKHLAILDLSDPVRPVEIGRWSDYAPDRADFTGHMHSVVPLAETWGGRHFTLLGPEYGGQPGPQPSGTLWVLDTTDPTAPFAVGAWTLPHAPEWTDVYMFSNHYFTVQGRTAFVSMYHGGVWAVDLAPVETAQDLLLLDSVGVFLPDRESPAPPTTMLRWTPTVQEVFAFPADTLVAFDGSSGVYTLRFDEARPATPPTPWAIPAPPAH